MPDEPWNQVEISGAAWGSMAAGTDRLFDRPQGQGSIPGWTKLSPSGVDLRLDAGTRHDGIQSLHLSSQGPIGGVISQPFVAPSTGRLSMSLWLRVANSGRQPPLRVAIEARPGDKSILRYAWFGQAPDRPTDPTVAPRPRTP